MLITTENYKEKFDIFKNSCDSAKFVSFDCEMSGLTLEQKTEFTKYDTQQFRYYKERNIVKNFDLLQLGLTFFIEQQNPQNNEQFYLERTFTFFLFKNPKLKIEYGDDHILNTKTLCFPDAIKFLQKSNFDFSTLITKGISYNKICYEPLFKNSIALKNNSLLNNSSVFLSKSNENVIIDNIFNILEFIVDNNNKSKTTLIKYPNKKTVIFTLGCNLRNLFSIDNFLVNKKDENTLEIKKSKIKLNTESFIKKYTSIENFKNILNNNHKIIYELKNEEKNTIDDDTLLENELGFGIYMKYLLEKKLPIVGHNISFDLMFIYEKLIDDLPEDYYTFKQKIHEYFPIIYDTKYVATQLKKIENTALGSIHKYLLKNNINKYVLMKQDIENNFDCYSNEQKLHDAGFDSIITGEIFILMNKAVQNNSFENIINSNKKKKKNEKLNDNNIINENAKIGFADFELFTKFANFSFMSYIEAPYDTIIFGEQDKNEFFDIENKLIKEKYKNVFMFVLKHKNEDKHFFNNYEVYERFSNDNFDMNIEKIDVGSFFIQFNNENDEKMNEKENIIKVIKEAENRNNEEKIIIEKVFDYEEFHKNYKELIKFNK